MKIIKELFFVIALFFFAPEASFAQNLTGAPLNPEFVKYRDSVTNARNAENVENLGLRPSPLDMSCVKLANNGSKASAKVAPLPDKFDLRDKGWMPPVRDQGNYDTCWTFALLASMESSLLAQGKGVHDFSRSHLAYFTFVDTPDMPAFTQTPVSPDKDPIYDPGGNGITSTAILARGTGIVNESDRPYQAGNPWLESERPLITDPISMRLSGFNYLTDKIETKSDRDAVKSYIMQNGAVSVAIWYGYDAYNSETYAHYSGVKYPWEGAANGIIAGILIAGWDDNFSKENFSADKRPAENGAWLIQGSYSESFGDKGYFWVSYEEDITQVSQLQAEEKGKYEHIYQYDPLGWTEPIGVKGTPGTASYANIFTANGNELVNAVSTYFTAPIAEYEISVYRDVAEGNPASGTLAQQLTFKSSGTDYKYAGYHKFELPSPVYVGNGEKFSVVVKLTTTGYEYAVPLESPIEGYSDKARANAGESFVFSENIWKDTALSIPNTNVCIKAFSTDAKSKGSSGCNAGTYFIALLALPFIFKKTR